MKMERSPGKLAQSFCVLAGKFLNFGASKSIINRSIHPHKVGSGPQYPWNDDRQINVTCIHATIWSAISRRLPSPWGDRNEWAMPPRSLELHVLDEANNWLVLAAVIYQSYTCEQPPRPAAKISANCRRQHYSTTVDVTRTQPSHLHDEAVVWPGS
jgi:hypothetical protein